MYSISSTPTAPAMALTSTELSIGLTSGLISIYTANSTKIGTHSAVLSVGLANYTGVSKVNQSFQITINPCFVTSFTSLTPSSKTYHIKNSPETWIVTKATTQVPACGYSSTISVDMSTVPAYVSVTS